MIDWPLIKMQEVASQKFNLNHLNKEFIGKFIHSSLSFDSDFLSLSDVLDIIDSNSNRYEEKVVAIVQNHYQAFLFVINMLKNNEAMDENRLKDIHEILMRKIGIGGLYRNVDISVNGSNHTPPSHIKVYDRMKKYFDTINSFEGDVFELAAYSHLQLVKIHPFLDGNARCSRLVLNYFLIKNHLAPIIIPHTDKQAYFRMLEEYKVEKNILPFINYIKNLEIETLKD